MKPRKIKMEPQVKEVPVVRRRTLSYFLAGLGLVLTLILLFIFINRRSRNIVSGLVTDPESALASTDGRTNLVFLGIGGKGHDAPDLTDSILFISLRHADDSVTMLSIPRDIWVDTLKAKINTAYHYGNERRDGAGRDLAKSAVSEVVGLPVHYAFVLDFDGFIKAIDAVGGIDVNVERTFDDFKYPIPGKENAEPESERYQHLHFDAGMQHMDGVTALRFARSRHAEGDEGTDFARGARQQKIILAFKDKLLQTRTLLNKDTMKNLIGSVQSSVDTDIKEDDYGSFLRFFLAFEKEGSKSTSLNIEEFLFTPKNKSPYAGQWILTPRNDWQEIHEYVQKSLE